MVVLAVDQDTRSKIAWVYKVAEVEESLDCSQPH